MNSSDEMILAPLAEVVIIITLAWRTLSLKRRFPTDHFEGIEGPAERWTRYSWFYEMIQRRRALLSIPSSSAELFDHMRLFTNLLVNAAVIWIHEAMEVSLASLHSILRKKRLPRANGTGPRAD